MSGQSPTVRHPVQVPRPPSGFVTVADRTPTGAVAAADTVRSMRLSGMTPVTVPVTPVPEKATFAPLTTPAPYTDAATLEPRATVLGCRLVGAGFAVTVKQALHEIFEPLVRVTVTARSPVVAALLTSTFATNLVDEEMVTLFVVTPLPKLTFVPVENPLP